jgi:hypothetical protein
MIHKRIYKSQNKFADANQSRETSPSAAADDSAVELTCNQRLNRINSYARRR